MRRREFLAGLGGSLVWSIAGSARANDATDAVLRKMIQDEFKLADFLQLIGVFKLRGRLNFVANDEYKLRKSVGGHEIGYFEDINFNDCYLNIQERRVGP